MAGVANLSVDQGADWSKTFTYCAGVPGSPGVAGAPKDVTGWTALMQIRTAPGSLLVLELNDDSAGITVGTTNGRFLVEMTDEQTAQFNQEEYHYDLLVADPGGNKIRLVEGTMTVDLAISVPS